MKPDLSQLRDIHLPPPVSWWPPAPGWWLLLMIFILLILGLWFVYRRHKRDAWRRTALVELAHLRQQYRSQQFTPQHIVGELSVLMRRVAVSYFPREQAAKLSGDEWLAFLDRSRRDGASFQSELGRLLVVAPYVRETVIVPEEFGKLLSLCENWIAGLPSGGCE